MDAHSVDRAAHKLASLKRLAQERLAVAVEAALIVGPMSLVDLRLGIAIGVGALFELVLVLNSSAQRGSLIASLALDRNAYLLPDVRRYGESLTTMANRRAVARSIASMLRDAGRSRLGVELVDRVTAQAPALAALGCALKDPETVVEPTAMAAFAQLLTDGRMSPLLNPKLPARELELALAGIHAGVISPAQASTQETSEGHPQAA